MSQEQRNNTTPSNEPTALTRHKSSEASVLSSIEERLIQAEDFQEIAFWTQARKAIIRQDEEAKNQEHQRFLERAQVWYKMGFSVIAFAVGIGLLIGGLTYPGLLISGAGLFGVAPDYVRAILRIFRRDKGGEDAEE